MTPELELVVVAAVLRDRATADAVLTLWEDATITARLCTRGRRGGEGHQMRMRERRAAFSMSTAGRAAGKPVGGLAMAKTCSYPTGTGKPSTKK